ncbi:type II toxin-antitoxin system HicB family antitoxin [Granulicella aggregans]|jgi:predicted RNase H-like HicB family nuclease|uniref:type II toxin-antitoxin system HicB family antitoxin n=1 Tax=Granulicella aggregans TaxID=474949 RepID=UPI0021DFA46B|nr:type II toxin-antitoxin system HicB family antitoxin [Granulicella aggregans]
MTRQYPVIYEWSGKNFAGFAPDIPGCMATAKTLTKIRLALKGALESHLQWMQDDGDPIPEASSETTVDMSDDPEFPNPPGYYVVVEKVDLQLPRKRRTTARKGLSREAVLA